MKIKTVRRIVSGGIKDGVYLEAKEILGKKKKRDRQNRKKGRMFNKRHG